MRVPPPAPRPRGRRTGTARGERRRPDPSLPCPGPQAYAAVTGKPSGPARLLKVGAVILISGAVLLLFGAIGAFYFWKGNDNHVSRVPAPWAERCAGWPGAPCHARAPR